MKMKRLCAAALAGLLIITGVPVVGNQTLVANAAESTNVAAGCSVVAWSGTETSSFTANLVTDGITNTDSSRWSSGVNHKEKGQNPTVYADARSYLVIDLGENTETSVNTNIIIRWHANAWATKYRIETSDTCEYNTSNNTISDLAAGSWELIKDVSRDSVSDAGRVDTWSTADLQSSNLKRYVRIVVSEMNTYALYALSLIHI